MSDRLTEEQLSALERWRAGKQTLSPAEALDAAWALVGVVADLRSARAERDAMRARLQKAREALNHWAGSTGERHPSRCPWNDYEHDEEAIPACDCGLSRLRAALEGETT